MTPACGFTTIFYRIWRHLCYAVYLWLQVAGITEGQNLWIAVLRFLQRSRFKNR